MRIRPLIACICIVLFAGSAAPVADPAVSVPASAGAVGTLVVAVDAAGAPYAFVDSDGQTVQGLDADLAHALANVLGFRLRIVEVRPAEIVPGDWISVTVSDDEEPEAEAQEVEMRVIEISPDAIVLDANHPLAGQAVIFDLHVVSVRQATAEEIAQRQAEAAAEDAAEDTADGDER